MSTKGMELFWGSGSIPCIKAMIALHEKGFSDIDKTLISFSEKGHKGPAVMAKNHRGQVPTFSDGGNIVNESMAICLYLEHAYPDKGTRLLPKDPAEYAKVIQTTMEAQENLNMKIIIKCIYFTWMTEESKRKEEAFQQSFKAAIEDAQKEMEIWETKLKTSGGDFICGKDFTLADVILFAYVAAIVRFGSSLQKYPTLRSYYDKLCERPSIKDSWPPHWKEGELEDAKKMLKGI